MAHKKFKVVKTCKAPEGEICVEQKLGFKDNCEICGLKTYVCSYTFSHGGVKNEDGFDLTMYDFTGNKLCGVPCFKQTEYYKTKVAG